jgi:hypothetical protein
MAKRPLIETNPYLRDADKRRKGIITNVSSSTTVETGRKVETIVRTLIRAERLPRLRTRRGSDR